MAEQTASISVEDALRVRKFGELTPIAFSPDSKRLAFTVQDNQKTKSIDPESFALTGVPPWASGTDICVLKTETGEVTNLTTGKGDNWLPAWSPDGHYLAFLSDRDGSGQARLWVWDAMHDELKKVSDIGVRGEDLQWTADSKELLITVVPRRLSLDDYVRKVSSGGGGNKVAESNAPGSTVVLYLGNHGSHDETNAPKSDPWNLDIILRDLVSVDIASGKITPMVEGKRIDAFLLSPDGSRIAYSIPTHFEKPGSQQMLFDLATIAVATKQERIIGSDIRLNYDGAAFSWSPDGSQLSFRTGGVEEKNFDCFVIDINSATPRNVTMLPPTTSPRRTSRPLWDTQGHIFFLNEGAVWQTSLDQSKAHEVARVPNREVTQIIPRPGNQLWAPDHGGVTIVVTHDDMGKQDGLYSIDLVSAKTTKLLETGQCYTCAYVKEPFTVTSDARRLAYFVEDAQHDLDLWMSDSSFRAPRRLTHLNPQFDKYKMGSARLIDWLSEDGEKLQGALLLPPDYQEGKRYPLIVWVYGGESLSDNFDHFGFAHRGPFNMQLLGTRGYAVLLPDAPQHLGTPMLDLAKTVPGAVTKVIDMGIADPYRLGVMGHSYGGYSVLALIVQTTRFKAAIEVDGYADLLGKYGAMNKDGTAFGTSVLEHGQGLMGGPPWQFPNRYIENSPIFYFDRVETPLLIVHGSRDDTVPPYLGDEVFVALRRLGKEVEYAKYEGEGHSPPYWSYGNQIDFCKRILEWFGRFLPSGK